MIVVVDAALPSPVVVLYVMVLSAPPTIET